MKSLSTALGLAILFCLLATLSSCNKDSETVTATIESVTLTKFPTQNNGTNWDLLDGADPYIEIYSEGTKLYTSNSHNNAEISQNQAFLDINLIIKDLSRPIEIRVMDKDQITEDQHMGDVSISLLNTDASTLTAENTQIAVEVEVSWTIE
jgi:Ca2+-dependent lipid-binding protein